MKKLIPYWVEDGNGKKIEVFVTEEVFAVLQEERKEVDRAAKEHERRGTDYDIEDEIVVFHHWKRHDSLEDCVVYNTEVARLMEFLDEHCTPKQKKRFLMVKFDGYSISETAKQENCSHEAVRLSIQAVEKLLKKFF